MSKSVSSSDNCRNLLSRAKSRIQKTIPPSRYDPTPPEDGDSDEITVNWIVEHKPKPSIVREFFKAQADFQREEYDDQFR